MKSKISINRIMMLLIAAWVVLPLSAQWRYGVRIGGTFASAHLSNAGDCSLDNRSGFSGGLVLEYTFAKSGLAPDIAIVYTRYNTRLRHLNDSPQSFGRNFIEIPIHLKYKIPVNFLADLINPMIYTGPSLAFKMGDTYAEPLTAKTFQPRWDFGVGVSVVNFIQLTGGYSLGMGNAVKKFESQSEACLRTNGWHVAANILFDF